MGKSGQHQAMVTPDFVAPTRRNPGFGYLSVDACVCPLQYKSSVVARSARHSVDRELSSRYVIWTVVVGVVLGWMNT